MARRLACVFGGSGFIGRQFVRRLAAQGFRVRVPVRDPEGAAFLKPMGDVGQVVPFRGDVGDQRLVAAAVEGAEVVVYAVGALVESGRGTFSALHVVGPANVAEAARKAGAAAFLHISSLAADPASHSSYARSKAEGETRVRDGFPGAIILRPSVVYGPDDSFFNRFAKLTTWSPALPVIGTGLYQPVYVEDVGEAGMTAIADAALHGRTFSLGGPGRYTLRQLLAMMLALMGRRRALIQVPLPLAMLKAAFLQFVPGKPLTPDQVRLLETDNIVPDGAPGFDDLGMTPTALEAVLPHCLARYRNQYIHAYPLG